MLITEFKKHFFHKYFLSRKPQKMEEEEEEEEIWTGRVQAVLHLQAFNEHSKLQQH